MCIRCFVTFRQMEQFTFKFIHPTCELVVFQKPKDGTYVILLEIDGFCFPPQIVEFHDNNTDTIHFFQDGDDFPDAFMYHIETERKLRLKAHDYNQFYIITFVPTGNFKNTHEYILDQYKKSKLVQQLEEKISVLEELVDRPDGAGCKYSYEQICSVLEQS